jgi:hypothetical protein
MHKITLRLITAAVCLLAIVCSRSEEQRKAELRRHVLLAENLSEKRQEALEAQRISNAKGELLSSNIQVAGITMPRGFKPKFVFDHEWHYDGEQTLRRVEAYFRDHLDATISSGDALSVVFTQARMKGEPNMQSVSLTIMPIPGRNDWTRIHIILPKPPLAVMPSPAQVQAELAARNRE